jgi:hypothetical protein
MIFSSLAAALIALTAPAAASAGPLVSSATNCDAQNASRTFLPWLDPLLYTPLSGGSFESGAAAWTLSGGAGVVSGNESFKVAGSQDSRALRLPAGSSATSPPICVGLDHPVLRLFTQKTSGLLASVKVEVLYVDAAGINRSLQLTPIGGGSSWQPSLPVPIVANVLTLLPGQSTAIAFRFTPTGGDWRIDDVYVDPRHSS